MGDMRYAQAFREEQGIDFPLLVDARREAYKAVELQVADAFHLLRRDNARARKRAMKAGIRRGAVGEHPFQLGGSFVFAPGNVDLFVHVSETFSDNADPRKFLRALRERGR